MAIQMPPRPVIACHFVGEAGPSFKWESPVPNSCGIQHLFGVEYSATSGFYSFSCDRASYSSDGWHS
jgi:hypothetical protein